MSRAMGDGRVGRRSVPPWTAVLSAQVRNRDVNDPASCLRSVTPRAAQGSFTSRFRVSGSEGRPRVRSRAVARPEAAREAVSFRPDE